MANSYNDFSLSFSHFVNPNSHLGSDYEHQDILSLDGFRLANKEISFSIRPFNLHLKEI